MIVKNERTKLVYSTEHPVSRKEKMQAAPTLSPGTSSQQRVLVKLDRKGRGGKSVTVVDGLQTSERDKEVLLKQLKAKLGTGGALKGGVLEIQGDHCAAVMQHLQGLGYRPKRSGG